MCVCMCVCLCVCQQVVNLLRRLEPFSKTFAARSQGTWYLTLWETYCSSLIQLKWSFFYGIEMLFPVDYG